MTVAATFLNSSPETPDITINNTYLQVSGTLLRWYNEYFTQGGAGHNTTSNTLTLAHMPVGNEAVQISYNGVVQGEAGTGPAANFAVSGNIVALEFDIAPSTGLVHAHYMAYAASLEPIPAVGTLQPYGGTLAPSGWVWADGTSSYTISDYPALYAFLSAHTMLLSETATEFVINSYTDLINKNGVGVEQAMIIKT